MMLLMFLLMQPLTGRAQQVESVATGLSYPWSLAFLPDGSMLVTERTGKLRVIRDGKLLEESIGGVPDVFFAGQGGLFDVMLDPDFASNRRLYLSFAFGDADANATRVVSAALHDGSLRDVQTIFTTVPFKDTPHHYGGRMAFLADGSLLLTTGDGFNYREQAQKLDNTLGKTVRFNPDGSVPPDNPFVDVAGARPEIFSYGHRNAQAIVRDPQTDIVYSHEHGPRGGDELNRIEPGLNYGWPAVTFGIDYNFAQVTPYTQLPGMQPPVAVWVPSIAPAGMTFYNGALFPEWRGNLIIASLAEKTIRRLELIDGAVTGQQILFADRKVRFRDVRTGPDGALYLLTDSENGELLRVTP